MREPSEGRLSKAWYRLVQQKLGKTSIAREGKVKLIKNSPVVDWLLEEEEPSVRHLALTELLDRPENDSDVKCAKENITKIGWAKDILENQTSEGYWVRERSLFEPKYIATF